MPDPATLGMIAVGGGSLLSSLGGLFGDDTPDPGEAFVTSLNLQNDPLNVALAFDAMLQLGNTEGAEALLQRANPLNQVINKINSAPLDLDTKNTAIGVANHLYATGQLPTPQDLGGNTGAFNAAMQRWQLVQGAAGLTQADLAQLNPDGAKAFNERVSQQLDQAASTGVGEARQSALRQLSERVKSMEGGGPGSFEALRDVASNTLAQNRDEQARLATEQALARANAGGFNPAGILGEIEKERLRQASASPLQANELAATLASNEDRDFMNLLQFLGFGTQAAQGATQITNQGAIGSAGIAASQLAAANQSRQTQPNTTGQALGDIGSSISTLGLLAGSDFFGKPGASGGKINPFGGGGQTTQSLIDDSFYRSLLG